MRTFSIEEYSVLIDGVPITGYDEGDDVVQVARRVESMQDRVGADGEMTTYLSADRSGTVTVRLAQSSDFNATFTTLAQAAEAGSYVPLQILIRDLKGNDTVVATNCYITKPSDVTRGTGPNSQEWVMQSESCQILTLGSPTI